MRVERGTNETAASLITRFVRLTKSTGLIREMRDREFFVGKGERRRHARAAAIRRARSAVIPPSER